MVWMAYVICSEVWSFSFPKESLSFLSSASKKNNNYGGYVDDIVITGDDAKEITNLKQYLLQYFQIKGIKSL